jgi:hypothetical protein
LQRELAQAASFRYDQSPTRLPLTEENLRALVSTVSVEKKARPMATPRNPSPTRKESVRTHLKRLAGYNITFDHGTPYPSALDQFVKKQREFVAGLDYLSIQASYRPLAKSSRPF